MSAPTGSESEPIGTQDEEHFGTGFLTAGDSDEALAAVLDEALEEGQPGLGDKKGDKKTAFTKMADEFVKAGDLRVWGDSDNRVAFAYQVNDALPEALQVTKSTARRYAEVYAVEQPRPEPATSGQIPHQAGSRADAENGIEARVG